MIKEFITAYLEDEVPIGEADIPRVIDDLNAFIDYYLDQDNVTEIPESLLDEIDNLLDL